jgi:transposase, IS5 family
VLGDEPCHAIGLGTRILNDKASWSTHERIEPLTRSSPCEGYRGHNYPNQFRTFITGQVKRTTAVIKREMKRRAAIEPVIGHVKAEYRRDRKGQDGDRIKAVLAAAGFNFHLLLRWLAALLRAYLLAAIQAALRSQRA